MSEQLYKVIVRAGREEVVVRRLSWGDAHQTEVAVRLALSGIGAKEVAHKERGRISDLLLGNGQAQEVTGVWELGDRNVWLELEPDNGEPK